MAALVDLASRDEIRFRAEPGGHRVGIELRGGESTDPRVRLNRRRPIGEGEAWLLTLLKQAPVALALQAAPAHGGEPDPAALLAGIGSMMQFLPFLANEQTADDSPEARARREHGMLDGQPRDPQALAAAVERSSGRPLSEQQREVLAKLSLLSESIGDPASIAADPDAFAARVEAIPGKPMSPKDVADVKAWAAQAVAPSPALASADGSTASRQPTLGQDASTYITGETALHFGAPILFGTLLETYARRHGWLGGLSFIERLRWHLTGLGEIAVALILLAVGSSAGIPVATGFGLGVGLGGMLTFLVAPRMIPQTAAGALIQAQIAAYRRSLQLTFAGAPSIADAIESSGVAWLDTPDQSIVWGIALGLRSDVEGLVARTVQDTTQASAPAGYQLTWFAAENNDSTLDAASMFAGIEAIGSEPGLPGRDLDAHPR